jgi:hypothetical protein
MKIKTFFVFGLLALSGLVFGQGAKSGNNSSDPAKQDPLTMQGSAPDDWTMAKGHEKGYLTKEDAPANSWLAQNFKSCDADGDGKVTESEYTKCQKAKVH